MTSNPLERYDWFPGGMVAVPAGTYVKAWDVGERSATVEAEWVEHCNRVEARVVMQCVDAVNALPLDDEKWLVTADVRGCVEKAIRDVLAGEGGN